MSIICKDFGSCDGKSVEQYTLIGNGGLEADILTYGATVRALRFSGVDTVCGYDDLDGYINGKSYQGASVGRYGNRIANAEFTLGGTKYTLDRNNNKACLHGGNSGFSHRVWEVCSAGGDEPSVKLYFHSDDGEGGFPGNLDEYVTYTVTDSNEFLIKYEAVSDKDTVFNPTCHAYFNPSGTGETALDVFLTVNADEFTAVNSELIPTENRAVNMTPFDFRKGKRVGCDLVAKYDQIELVKGYDHNFILNGKEPAATLFSDKTGIAIECYTTEPGIQVYTATNLDEPCGKGGKPLRRFDAVCLETQHFPNSPNRPDFPSTVLYAGEHFESETVYKFIKK